MTQNQPRLGGTLVDGQLSQFDLLLVAIPLALAAGVVSTFFMSVPQFVGITLGATLAASFVGYGIYAISPVKSTPSGSAQTESTPTDSETRLGDHIQRAD